MMEPTVTPTISLSFWTVRQMGLLAVYQGGTLPVWVVLSLFALCAVIGYLLGSINSAVILSAVRYRDDIRKHGSGNAGMTNMLRTYGKSAAVLTLVFDALKAIVSVIIAILLCGIEGAFVAALFCMLGHMFPLYFHFRGGKGVVVVAASLLVLDPLTFAVSFLIFLSVFLASKYVSLSSIMAALCFPLFLNRLYLLQYRQDPGIVVSGISLIMALLIVVMHRANIKRLLNGTESKTVLRKKKD